MKQIVFPSDCPFRKAGGICLHKENGGVWDNSKCDYPSSRFVECPLFREHMAKMENYTLKEVVLKSEKD